MHGELILKPEPPMFWSRNCKMSASIPAKQSSEAASNSTGWVVWRVWGVKWAAVVPLVSRLLPGDFRVYCFTLDQSPVCCCGFNVSIWLAAGSFTKGG